MCIRDSVVAEAAVKFDIGAAEADALAVDAGEIGLTADAGAEAGVEGVVPDVELPGMRGIDCGQEIDCLLYTSRCV